MINNRRLNTMFDEMIEDIDYSKMLAFLRILNQIEEKQKEAITI